MKKSFSVRRVPRKVGEDDASASNENTGSEGASEPTLIRPSSKPRKGSSLRTSFAPGADEDDESASTGVVAPKRSNISRLAIQRNAAQRSAQSSALNRHGDEDQPTYSTAYLQELKESTPTTPRDITTDTSNSDVEDVANDTQALDISSKFGTNLSRHNQPSAIPSASEIAEKKARRARLAKEQEAEEFISLNPSDPELDNDDDDGENVMRDDSGRLILKPKEKEADSRLVRDDEDIMENFEEFTEPDQQILWGRKAEAEAAQKRKADIATRIAEAEGASNDSDSDQSEKERNEAFEAAQTKHGTYGSNQTSNDPYAAMRPKTPPIISPLPTLDGIRERLRKQVAGLQTSRMEKLQEMEALQREKIRLGEEEIRIQRALKETADKFEQLRTERGIEAHVGGGTSSALDVSGFAARLDGGPGVGVESGASTDIEETNSSRLGLGMAGRGLDSLGTSAVGTPMAVDSD